MPVGNRLALTSSTTTDDSLALTSWTTIDGSLALTPWTTIDASLVLTSMPTDGRLALTSSMAVGSPTRQLGKTKQGDLDQVGDRAVFGHHCPFCVDLSAAGQFPVTSHWRHPTHRCLTASCVEVETSFVPAAYAGYATVCDRLVTSSDLVSSAVTFAVALKSLGV